MTEHDHHLSNDLFIQWLAEPETASFLESYTTLSHPSTAGSSLYSSHLSDYRASSAQSILPTHEETTYPVDEKIQVEFFRLLVAQFCTTHSVPSHQQPTHPGQLSFTVDSLLPVTVNVLNVSPFLNQILFDKLLLFQYQWGFDVDNHANTLPTANIMIKRLHQQCMLRQRERLGEFSESSDEDKKHDDDGHHTSDSPRDASSQGDLDSSHAEPPHILGSTLVRFYVEVFQLLEPYARLFYLLLPIPLDPCRRKPIPRAYRRAYFFDGLLPGIKTLSPTAIDRPTRNIGVTIDRSGKPLGIRDVQSYRQSPSQSSSSSSSSSSSKASNTLSTLDFMNIPHREYLRKKKEHQQLQSQFQGQAQQQQQQPQQHPPVYESYDHLIPLDFDTEVTITPLRDLPINLNRNHYLDIDYEEYHRFPSPQPNNHSTIPQQRTPGGRTPGGFLDGVNPVNGQYQSPMDNHPRYDIFANTIDLAPHQHQGAFQSLFRHTDKAATAADPSQPFTFPMKTLSIPPLSLNILQRTHLQRAHFEPLLQSVVSSHQGLDFLSSSSEFQTRYSHTVISRLFYKCRNGGYNQMSLLNLRNLDLVSYLDTLHNTTDINIVHEFFSYEHFYVIYCKYWELDSDHDMLVHLQDLEAYEEGSLTETIIHSILDYQYALTGDHDVDKQRLIARHKSLVNTNGGGNVDSLKSSQDETTHQSHDQNSNRNDMQDYDDDDPYFIQDASSLAEGSISQPQVLRNNSGHSTSSQGSNPSTHLRLTARNCLSYHEFVSFFISEVDKTSPFSARYWFPRLDYDADGYISPDDLLHFFREQQQRLGEASDSRDTLCLIHDMINANQTYLPIWTGADTYQLVQGKTSEAGRIAARLHGSANPLDYSTSLSEGLSFTPSTHDEKVIASTFGAYKELRRVQFQHNYMKHLRKRRRNEKLLLKQQQQQQQQQQQLSLFAVIPESHSTIGTPIHDDLDPSLPLPLGQAKMMGDNEESPSAPDTGLLSSSTFRHSTRQSGTTSLERVASSQSSFSAHSFASTASSKLHPSTSNSHTPFLSPGLRQLSDTMIELDPYLPPHLRFLRQYHYQEHYRRVANTSSLPSTTHGRDAADSELDQLHDGEPSPHPYPPPFSLGNAYGMHSKFSDFGGVYSFGWDDTASSDFYLQSLGIRESWLHPFTASPNNLYWVHKYWFQSKPSVVGSIVRSMVPSLISNHINFLCTTELHVNDHINHLHLLSLPYRAPQASIRSAAHFAEAEGRPTSSEQQQLPLTKPRCNSMDITMHDDDNDVSSFGSGSSSQQQQQQQQQPFYNSTPPRQTHSQTTLLSSPSSSLHTTPTLNLRLTAPSSQRTPTLSKDGVIINPTTPNTSLSQTKVSTPVRQLRIATPTTTPLGSPPAAMSPMNMHHLDWNDLDNTDILTSTQQLSIEDSFTSDGGHRMQVHDSKQNENDSDQSYPYQLHSPLASSLGISNASHPLDHQGSSLDGDLPPTMPPSAHLALPCDDYRQCIPPYLRILPRLFPRVPPSSSFITLPVFQHSGYVGPTCDLLFNCSKYASDQNNLSWNAYATQTYFALAGGGGDE